MINTGHLARWTYADYLRLPDDGTRCEILDGERVMTPSPLTPHQRVSGRLFVLIERYATPDLGEIFHAPCDVILADDVVVQPDLLFIAKARASIVQRRGVFGAPDLVVEILSESDPARDTVRKRRIYERFGVPEYWIVDPDAKRIEVLVHQNGKLVRAAVHDEGIVRSSVAIPGFAAPLDALFTTPF